MTKNCKGLKHSPHTSPDSLISIFKDGKAFFKASCRQSLCNAVKIKRKSVKNVKYSTKAQNYGQENSMCLCLKCDYKLKAKDIRQTDGTIIL